tara:strand:+ start:252 stop:479 length:228 start_codon:yes stop_codon:yes gene_type:complete
MIEDFIKNIPNNTEIIGISVVAIILLIVSFIKKIEKLAILTLIGLLIYAGYLYYTDKEPTEKQKEFLKNPKNILN